MFKSRKFALRRTMVISLALLVSLLGTMMAFAAHNDPVDPNDPLYDPDPPAIGLGQWGPRQINAEGAWDLTRGEGAVIAIVDSGVDIDHEDLAGNIIPGATFAHCPTLDVSCGNGDWQSGPGDGDRSEHGTHVAGIAAAVGNNNVGIAGVAPNADLMPVRVPGEGFLPCLSEAWEEVGHGVRWAADNGADVINLSLGHPAPGGDQICDIESTALREDIIYANSLGVVVVASAGNSAWAMCSGPPGSTEGVICVTATDSKEAPAEYSNHALKEDLIAVSAPGGGIVDFQLRCGGGVLSTVPPGMGDADIAEICNYPTNLAYDELEGTSMASPHVAGVAGLLASMGCNRLETIDLITSTARQPGVGVRGVFNPVYGYGIVDAEAAANAALTSCEPLEPNEPPIANDDSGSTSEETSVVIDVLANDSDPDSQPAPIKVSALTQPSNGTAIDNGDGTITYSPASNFNGTDSFTYSISDGQDTDSATVTVEVSAVDDPPIAIDDFAFFEPGVPTNVPVLDNDLDATSLGTVGTPTNGTAVGNPDDTVTFTSDPSFDGRSSFMYEAMNGAGSDAGTAHMFGPSCLGDFFDDIEGNPDLDADNPFSRGWVTDLGESGSPLTLIWFPHNDPLAHSPTQSWFDEAASPLVKDDRVIAPSQLVSPDTLLTFWHRFKFDVGSGGPIDGGVLEISTDGGASWNDVESAGGAFVEGGYNGTMRTNGNPGVIPGRQAWTGFSPGLSTTMSQVVVDLGALSGQAINVRWRLALDQTVVIGDAGTGWWVDDVGFSDVISADCLEGVFNNLPPVAADDSASTNQDAPVDVDVLANDSDPDGDPVHVFGVGDPANGTAVNNGDGTITYTPDPGFFGTDTFPYTISDGQATDEGLVTVDVNGLPVANDDSASTPEETPVDVDVLANDSDPDGGTLAISAFSQGSNGSVVQDSADGSLIYTPNPGFNGADSFTYTIGDGQGGSDTATVNIQVTSVNDRPDAVNDQAMTKKNTSVKISVLANDTDPEGDTLTITAVSKPTKDGTATKNADGTITFEPKPGFTGTDTFTYTISDGNGGTDTATVSVKVVKNKAGGGDEDD